MAYKSSVNEPDRSETAVASSWASVSSSETSVLAVPPLLITNGENGPNN